MADIDVFLRIAEHAQGIHAKALQERDAGATVDNAFMLGKMLELSRFIDGSLAEQNLTMEGAPHQEEERQAPPVIFEDIMSHLDRERLAIKIGSMNET